MSIWEGLYAITQLREQFVIEVHGEKTPRAKNSDSKPHKNEINNIPQILWTFFLSHLE